MKEYVSRALQDYLRDLISRQVPSLQIRFKTIAQCGKKILLTKDGRNNGVYLMANNVDARFTGITHCRNPYACPCCSAQIMAKYAQRFAALIDEMEKRGYFAFMMTFTVPHLLFMQCAGVTELLYQTMRYVKKTKRGVYKQFCDAVHLEHYVHVCEYTWGRNGWHPHIHGLCFIPIKYKNEVLKWQEDLRDYWLSQTKRISLKLFPEKKETIETLYAVTKNENGCYISQKDGKIFQCKAAHYLAGWGADTELTGLEHKEAQAGHLTPHQILELAFKGNKKMEGLYIEFLIGITEKTHRRVTWSRTGLRAIAENSFNGSECLKYSKKKEEDGEWKLLLWFTAEQWSYINHLGGYTISNILYLAAHNKEVLLEYLKDFIPYKKAETCFWRETLEKIYNAA